MIFQACAVVIQRGTLMRDGAPLDILQNQTNDLRRLFRQALHRLLAAQTFQHALQAAAQLPNFWRLFGLLQRLRDFVRLPARLRVLPARLPPRP